MQRSPFSPAPFLLFTLSVLLLVTACTAPVEAPVTEVDLSQVVVIATPLETPTNVLSVTPTPTARPTRKPISATNTPNSNLITEDGFIEGGQSIDPVTPFPTKTPIPVIWKVEQVIEIDDQDIPYYWVDDDTLLITRNNQDFFLDIENGHLTEPIPVPTSIAVSSYRLSYSWNNNFSVECFENRMSLYEMPSEELLGEFIGAPYCNSINWKADESELVFTTEDDFVFIWKTNGTPPVEIGQGISWGPLRWSPDQTKILTMWQSPDQFDYSLRLLYPDGRPAYETGIIVEFGRNNWYPDYVNWLTDDVISDAIYGDSYSLHYFYDLTNGELLIEQEVDYGVFGQWNQKYQISPDYHWIIYEEQIYQPDNVHTQIRLFDLSSKLESIVSDIIDFNMQFIGWVDDTNQFYAVNRPISEFVESSSEIPLGLIALNPVTKGFDVIIPDIVYASWNWQEENFFALHPINGQLTAALYTLSGDLLAPFQPVTDDLPYLTPGEGLPIPAAWSNDGTQIVFSDVWGDLWLTDTSGAVTQLADNLGFDPAYPRQPRFSWSPDDSHLLITFNDRAWVVTMP